MENWVEPAQLNRSMVGHPSFYGAGEAKQVVSRPQFWSVRTVSPGTAVMGLSGTQNAGKSCAIREIDAIVKVSRSPVTIEGMQPCSHSG